MGSYAFFVAKFYYRVGRGAAPMALVFRIFAVVPKFLGVAVFLDKSGSAGLRLKIAPVKGHCGGVEKLAVCPLVPFVVFVRAKLVEVENVRAEYEVVLELLDFHVAARSRFAEIYDGVCLAVLFDVCVYLFAHFGSPFFPVLRGDDFFGVFALASGDFYGVRCFANGAHI